jgi:hypothetical protein
VDSLAICFEGLVPDAQRLLEFLKPARPPKGITDRTARFAWAGLRLHCVQHAWGQKVTS